MKAPFLALLIPFAVLAACKKAEPPPVAAEPTPPPVEAPLPTSAQVSLAGASGSAVQGELTLTAADGGVTVAGDIKGLAPSTVHGFHVHETGDCSAPDAKSAGGHFNPGKMEHGAPDSAVHHLGDIPNVQSNADGVASVSATVSGATLRDGGANDLVGKAVIVHAKPDDYKTQPSGDAGDRIACGVVK